jgi:chromosome segregation ATPase
MARATEAILYAMYMHSQQRKQREFEPSPSGESNTENQQAKARGHQETPEDKETRQQVTQEIEDLSKKLETVQKKLNSEKHKVKEQIQQAKKIQQERDQIETNYKTMLELLEQVQKQNEEHNAKVEELTRQHKEEVQKLEADIRALKEADIKGDEEDMDDYIFRPSKLTNEEIALEEYVAKHTMAKQAQSFLKPGKIETEVIQDLMSEHLEARFQDPKNKKKPSKERHDECKEAVRKLMASAEQLPSALHILTEQSRKKRNDPYNDHTPNDGETNNILRIKDPALYTVPHAMGAIANRSINKLDSKIAKTLSARWKHPCNMIAMVPYRWCERFI